MSARPMLAHKVLETGTASAWFGLPPQRIPDADFWRWRACLHAARLTTRRE